MIPVNKYDVGMLTPKELLDPDKLEIWITVCHEINQIEGSFYFLSSSGYLRCKKNAEAGNERALRQMALFAKKLLTRS